MTSATAELMSMMARDGQKLVGWHYGHPRPQAAVLICGATGVRQRFYANFATWLASQGYAVLTFDYRGIGDSLHNAHPRQSRARKQHWGEYDMPAALDALAQRHPGVPLLLIGHSVGGQLVGLMPNHDRLDGVVQVASSSGYVGGIRMPTRWAARLLLALYVPATVRLLRYTPAKRIGWGEDLPAGVARQWARWCLRPGYVLNGFEHEVQHHYYDEFRAPIVSIAASDDPIATRRNVDDLLRLFTQAPQQRLCLEPNEFGLQRIGHVDWFRPALSRLWPEMLTGLQGCLSR
ncbi:alpha/beta fold hydrolase [Hydrocarboniphaga effusa]|jgi:predicted alpha/beta hydrolase|uniref:alpha/beta hydrolase family protein n=1 Tax=Hydrocarboniphaga effusa TaxID=243629 RepID=UPI00398BD2BE